MRDESRLGSAKQKKHCQIRSISVLSSEIWGKVVFGIICSSTAGTTDKTKFAKKIGNVELTRRNKQPVPKAVKIKSSKETVHRVELTATWREIAERKLNTCKTIKRVDGLARTTKAKASPARARVKASKTKTRAEAILASTKARTRRKEGVNTTERKGRKYFTKCRGTKTNKKDKFDTKTQSGLDGLAVE